MKVVVNQLTYDHTKVSGEKFSKPSLTIPDATMSLRELLDRYGRGLPVSGTEPVYHGDEEEMPNLKTMDLTEIQQMKEDVANAVKHHREKAFTESSTKRAAKDAEKKKKSTLFERMEKLLDNQEQKTTPNE